MKKIFLLISSLCLFLLLKGQTPANDPHWELLWEDHFTSTFDTNKWIKADQCDHDGEPQLYKPANVDITNGKLRIRTFNESATCNGLPNTYVCGTCVSGTHNYSTGWVNSINPPGDLDYRMHYGYAEARICMPYGNGLWPAFWLWSGDSRYEEIDIVELFPGMLETGTNIYNGQRHNQYVNTSHLHYAVTNGGTWTKVHQDYVYPIDNYNDWHTYGIEWSPNKIIIYVDGIVVNNIQNPQINDPKSIIFNIALLRRNITDPDKYCDIIYPYTGIPAEMRVDYIKVFTLNGDCDNAIWTCNYNLSNHDNMVKRVISIGGSGCSNSVLVGENVTLRAKEYVIINGDFTVPLGAEFYVDCNNPCY
jgi:beta-glucanase (GH16 family)